MKRELFAVHVVDCHTGDYRSRTVYLTREEAQEALVALSKVLDGIRPFHLEPGVQIPFEDAVAQASRSTRKVSGAVVPTCGGNAGKEH